MGTNKNLLSKKEIKELIDDWEFVLSYSPQGSDSPFICLIDPNVNDVEIKVRDKIHELGLDDDERVKKLDQKAIKYVLEVLPATYREKPPQAKDLKRWWWHLDKIALREYPAQLLPEHLRKIYENF